MKFGIYPSVTRGDGDLRALFDEVCQEAAAAETSGFAWCLVGEHHQEPALASPLLTAGLIAMRTRTIGVGTAVLLLPLHHPVHVAEQATMIDRVSQGRLVLGIGAGYQAKDFATFGTSMRDRGALLDEGVEILRRCWSEPTFDFHGEHFRLEGVSLGARPRDPSSIPLWIGANSEAALKRVAARADAWLASRTKPLQTIREWSARYRAEARALGRPSQVHVIRDAWIADTRAEAVEGYEAALRASLACYAGNEAYVSQIEAMLAARAAGEAPRPGDAVILGSPEDCIEQVLRWKQAGVDGLLLRFRHPAGPRQRDIVNAVRLFGHAVIPAVNKTMTEA